jgi:protein-disulfide isomerase
METILSSVVALSAAVVALSLAKREFLPASPNSAVLANAQTLQPRLIPDWEQAVTVGTPSTNDSTPVTLVEFADLECPYCRKFHQELLPELRKEFGSDLKFVFVHFPIPSHRFAKPAARLMECAKTRGAYWQMLDAIYSAQDSLGLKSWGSFAKSKNATDSTYYEDCARNENATSAIVDGLAFGERANVRGTPAIMLNGWLFDQPPSHETLRGAIKAMIEGKEPFLIPN